MELSNDEVDVESTSPGKGNAVDDVSPEVVELEEQKISESAIVDDKVGDVEVLEVENEDSGSALMIDEGQEVVNETTEDVAASVENTVPTVPREDFVEVVEDEDVEMVENPEKQVITENEVVEEALENVTDVIPQIVADDIPEAVVSSEVEKESNECETGEEMDTEVVDVDGESRSQTEEVNVGTEEESVEDVNGNASFDESVVILDGDVEMSGNENDESLNEVDKSEASDNDSSNVLDVSQDADISVVSELDTTDEAIGDQSCVSVDESGEEAADEDDDMPQIIDDVPASARTRSGRMSLNNSTN